MLNIHLLEFGIEQACLELSNQLSELGEELYHIDADNSRVLLDTLGLLLLTSAWQLGRVRFRRRVQKRRRGCYSCAAENDLLALDVAALVVNCAGREERAAASDVLHVLVERLHVLELAFLHLEDLVSQVPFELAQARA